VGRSLNASWISDPDELAVDGPIEEEVTRHQQYNIWSVVFYYLLLRLQHCNLKDDDDIKREIKKLFVNTNTLVNRFQRCSHNVKLVLFKSFCTCMYDLALEILLCYNQLITNVLKNFLDLQGVTI